MRGKDPNSCYCDFCQALPVKEDEKQVEEGKKKDKKCAQVPLLVYGLLIMTPLE